MVATFMTLIMTKRMSAVAALIVLPIVFGLLAGAGTSVGKMMIEGVLHVTPTALMLAFAVLFFAIMMDAGLFDPLVRRVVATVGDDPMRISIGTAVLATVVSLDGDGTTTALIVVTAMLPVYRRVGMNPLILATLLALCNALLNLVPWGGPAARAAIALRVDLSDIFLPLIPAMCVGLLAVLCIAWSFGRSERLRLAAGSNALVKAHSDLIDEPPQVRVDDSARRPHLFWFNAVLTLLLLAAMVLSVAPLPVLMMGAFAIAVTVNYPHLT
jgi:CitMHS family citrate-Mg2+:H+ or citrate-Ca2+:H+ symporter